MGETIRQTTTLRCRGSPELHTLFPYYASQRDAVRRRLDESTRGSRSITPPRARAPPATAALRVAAAEPVGDAAHHPAAMERAFCYSMD